VNGSVRPGTEFKPDQEMGQTGRAARQTDQVLRQDLALEPGQPGSLQIHTKLKDLL
jgi:hypothetical protein